MKHGNIRSCVLFISFAPLITAHVAFAAQIEHLHETRNIETLNKQHGPAAKAASPQDRGRRYAEILDLDQDSTFNFIRSSEFKGQRHYRFQQMFRGVPVRDAVVVINENEDGSLRYLAGQLARELVNEVPSVDAQISPQQALTIAKRATLIDQYAGAKTQAEKAEKVIYINDSGVARLSYEVSFFAAGPTEAKEPHFYIDANTGEILRQWEGSRHANATGPGGNLKTGLYEYGTQRGYLDVTQSGTTCTMLNAKVRTIDLNGATAIPDPTPFSFTCPRNTVRPINEAYAPLNDAHFYGSIVHDMFVTYAGMAPWDTSIEFWAHYGTDIATAGYYPSLKAVLIGDGNATTRYPLAILDVLGHEVAHGFTAKVHGLSDAGQPAAIDEAFGDMAGEAAEYYFWQITGGGTNNFEFGRAAVKGTGTIRNMSNPTADGHSIAHASNYVDGMSKYDAAGVYNKAFYLLATKSGWNTRKAFEVFARANESYWTPTTKFDFGACGVERAASDFGYASLDVTAAFASVGVSCGVTWDPYSYFTANIPPIFDNLNKTISTPAVYQPFFVVAGTTPKNSGKRYLEFKIGRFSDDSSPGGSLLALGLMGPQNDDLSEGCNTQAFCARFYLAPNGPNTASYFSVDGWTIDPWWDDNTKGQMTTFRVAAGDTVGLAVDINSGKIWISKNGVWSGSPSAGTNPVYDQANYHYPLALSPLSGVVLKPIMYSYLAVADLTIRGNQSEFVYQVPTGFVPWTNP